MATVNVSRERPRVILIAGPAGSGKSTLAAWIAQEWGYRRLSLMDPLTRFAEDLLGPGKHRSFKQRIGTAVRADHPTAFVDRARRITEAGGRWVLDDIRYPTELAAWPDALSIGLMAPPQTRALRLAVRDGAAMQNLDHATEQMAVVAVAACQWHFCNEGSLEDLYHWCRSQWG